MPASLIEAFRKEWNDSVDPTYGITLHVHYGTESLENTVKEHLTNKVDIVNVLGPLGGNAGWQDVKIHPGILRQTRHVVLTSIGTRRS